MACLARKISFTNSELDQIHCLAISRICNWIWSNSKQIPNLHKTGQILWFWNSNKVVVICKFKTLAQLPFPLCYQTTVPELIFKNSNFSPKIIRTLKFSPFYFLSHLFTNYMNPNFNPLLLSLSLIYKS